MGGGSFLPAHPDELEGTCRAFSAEERGGVCTPEAPPPWERRRDLGEAMMEVCWEGVSPSAAPNEEDEEEDVEEDFRALIAACQKKAMCYNWESCCRYWESCCRYWESCRRKCL